MFDINQYFSHRDKKLQVHVEGVIDKTRKITSLKPAEVSAIFHDAGKLNPNFQKKLFNGGYSGYSNHAYLSAYIFWCYYCSNPKKAIGDFNIKSINDLLRIITLIAKHHSNLPNFSPNDRGYSGFDNMLNEDETNKLFDFISKENILAEEFVEIFLPKLQFNQLLKDQPVQSKFLEIGYSFQKENNDKPLGFFLETQFSFASLILADKMDASNNDNNNQETVSSFCQTYNSSLIEFLKTLEDKQHIPINQLRTEVRINAVNKLSNALSQSNERVFTLTAPTGSGKTLMLLSLAGEIIKQKGNYRIIYALPFLSITEQVEAEVLKIFRDEHRAVQRIDSKSENTEFEKFQIEFEENPTKEIVQKLLSVQFQEDTFSYPFVITTFVRFFETLLSNRNATLLKLPNFSKSIFLIDEIQALPPRLYSFFIALLTEFCKKFDSYAVISTATMPHTELPSKSSNYGSIEKVFSNYVKPTELSNSKYFQNPLFNRYTITKSESLISIEELAENISNESNSVLVILNTIDDTKNLYNCEVLKNENRILLNTHFTPNDRKKKIQDSKDFLNSNKKVILISTQLIEAGVDIDFPVLYRDMATMPSIIQSAGRCNRNGRINSGKVEIFNLHKNGKQRVNLIYRGKDKQLLDFTERVLVDSYTTESELFYKQAKYFEDVGTKLEFGKHKQGDFEIDFVEEILEAGFENLGKFRLIDKNYYGTEFTCYIPKDRKDDNFIKLKELAEKQFNAYNESIQSGLFIKSQIKEQLKKMSGQILQVRIRPEKDYQPPFEDKIFDIHLVSRESYSYDKGMSLEQTNLII